MRRLTNNHVGMKNTFEMKSKFEISENTVHCCETVLRCHTTLICKEGVNIPTSLNGFPSEKNLSFV